MKENKVKILFCGDFCSTSPANRISVSADLRRIIRDADISICNFEAPILPDNYVFQQDVLFPKLFQRAESATFLQSLGFDLFSFSNNHVFDCGIEGYQKTVSCFESDTLIGSGQYNEAYTVKIIEKKGLKIGFLALTYASFGTHDQVNSERNLGCAYINDPIVNHIVLEAKKNLDFLILLVHDGIEYIDIPLPETRQRYKDLIDYGVDVIVGTHSHCPQGYETYHNGLIFYSLGNFFFNSKETVDFKTNLPYWYNGIAVGLELSKDSRITYKIYHTINKENRNLELNDSMQMISHMEYLCRLLDDDHFYFKKLDEIALHLLKTKYIPIFESTFNSLTMKNGYKYFIRTLMNVFSKRCRNYKKMTFVIRSDAERNLFIRGIKLMNKYN